MIIYHKKCKKMHNSQSHIQCTWSLLFSTIREIVLEILYNTFSNIILFYLYGTTSLTFTILESPKGSSLKRRKARHIDEPSKFRGICIYHIP